MKLFVQPENNIHNRAVGRIGDGYWSRATGSPHLRLFLEATRGRERTPGPFGPGAIGGYFLIATIVYVLAGALVASGKLYKLANLGLIILAVVDNILLIYTRTMPNIFFGRIIPWSWEWYPVGTVQIFIGQMIIIVLCAYLLQKGKATKQITKP